MEWVWNLIGIVLVFIPVCVVIGFIWFTRNFDSVNLIIQEKPKPTRPKTEFEEIFGV